jgi:hypothetical protein
MVVNNSVLSPSLPFLPLGTWGDEILELGKRHHELLFLTHTSSEDEFERKTAALEVEAERKRLPSLTFACSRLRHWRHHGISSVNVGGTMGCGKSSVSEFITERLGFELRDADYFHTDAARQKMTKGEPLSDADRYPFLRDTQAWLTRNRSITTCSALTDLYRAILCGQDATVTLTKEDPRRESPWKMESPNFGLLLIILKKPYSLALEELDRAFREGPPRMFNGKPHFIQVSKESEATARSSGKTPLLESQYNLLYSNPPLPWEALSIDAESLRSESGDYSRVEELEGLVSLPFCEKLASGSAPSVTS